ncbi:MAG: FecR domain-containing protein [Spirochaetia bacterium]|jgi:hypothetical protein
MKKTAAVLALVLLFAGAAAFAADKASIVYIEGDVTMNGAPAAVGDDVQPGALITTAKDSVCQVVFNSRNIVHMAAGTTLRFDLNAVSKGATLQKGAIAMVLRNLAAAAPGDELRFSIRTSTAVAGVRGTCFFVAVEDENNTYICACNGALHLEGQGGQFTQNIASSHHREVRVTRSAAGISVSAAPLEYHTDGDVEAVAARIGETIDWTKIDR